MSKLAKLYDDVMLDHIRNARNYRVIEDADRSVRLFNPLCGDEVTVYLKLDEDVISDIGFQCSCCGISMASASIMTEQVKGKNKDQAQAAVREFMARLREPSDMDPLGELQCSAVLNAAREFPTRRD